MTVPGVALDPLTPIRLGARGASVAAGEAKRQAAGAVDYAGGLAKGGIETMASGFATASQPLADAAKTVSGDVRAVIETGLDTGKKLLLGEILLVALGLVVVGGVVWVYVGAPGASSGMALVKRALGSATGGKAAG